jgi:hypothetical protein
MQTEIATTTPTDANPLTPDPEEVTLIAEIHEAWTAHVSTQRTIHNTSDELSRIRRSLAEKLFSLKTALCRPGRSGAWSSFLREQAIPRATADRLVCAHRDKLEPVGNSCLTEQIKEPVTEVTILRYLNSLWPKLSRVLTTRESVELFIMELRQRIDKSFGAVEQASSSTASDGAAATL